MGLAYPRGAVACVCVCVRTLRVALVTRTKPPQAGIWALPGGKVELGENTMAAAARELEEECSLSRNDVRFAMAPFTVSDVIRPEVGTSNPGTDFHYMIAQALCYTRPTVEPEMLRAGDDAGDAKWYTIEEMEGMKPRMAPNVLEVVKRGLLLYEKGLLPLEGDDDADASNPNPTASGG